MKVLGIVCEYNPFHNGHKYLIDEAKKITNADFVIAVMSGNFTQQGNIALYDKFTRANMAILNGVDLVIEIPTIFANSSAEYFCTAAIKILNDLNIIDYIAFGTECDDIKILNNIANIIFKNDEIIWKNISNALNKGISFASARYEVISKLLNDEEKNELSKPNNILAIDYLKTLIKLDSTIIPIAVKRCGDNFNQKEISNNSFCSASAIRECLYKNNDINKLKLHVPQNVFKVIQNSDFITNQKLFYLLKYKILSLGKSKLKDINEITEGLENKIYDAINISKSYLELVQNIKSKRYQESKIRRILVNILLEITKDSFSNILNEKNYYAHIIGISDKGKKNLSKIFNASNIPILIKKLDFDIIKNLNLKKCIEYDVFASNLYSIISNTDLYKDFTNKI